jgi:hypothetical protein
VYAALRLLAFSMQVLLLHIDDDVGGVGLKRACFLRSATEEYILIVPTPRNS